MSKSDSISATSYWSRQKFKFKADAVHDDMSRLNYELMIIAETADRPLSIQQFTALMKVLDEDIYVSEQRVGAHVRRLVDRELFRIEFDEDHNRLYSLNEATMEDSFDPPECYRFIPEDGSCVCLRAEHFPRPSAETKKAVFKSHI